MLTSIDTTITNTSPTLLANQKGAKYLWLDCGKENVSIPSATANGNYAVEITLNGCLDTTTCEKVTGVTIGDNPAFSTIIIYPNPVKDLVTIGLGAISTSVSVSLTSINGKVLYSLAPSTSETGEVTIDMSEYSTGVYFLKIVSGTTQQVYKVIKQ